MAFLTNDSERKSFIITTAIFVVMLLVIFLYRFQVVETTENMLMGGGEMAIRFGNSEKGSGPLIPADLPAPSSQEETQPRETQAEAAEKRIVTQNTKETAVVKSSETPKKSTNTAVRNNETTRPANRVNQSTNDLLNQFNSTSQGTSTTGMGEDNVSGRSGSLDGDPYSISRFGGGGSGGGSGIGVGGGVGWGLNGRQFVSHTVHKPTCPNEEGTVVIEVTVNKSGTVTEAKRSLTGTTNTTSCLVDAAIKTAKTFKWKADSKAPDRQIGFVVITFKSN